MDGSSERTDILKAGQVILSDSPSMLEQDMDNMKVKEFCEYVEPLVKAVLYNSKENARLAELRDTLLPRLMSGELKINDISV